MLLKTACPPTITYHPLPRTQTSLFRCARKGKREGDNGRDVASPAVCTLPMVPCGSSPVTRVSRSPLPCEKRSAWRRGCTAPSWKRILHVAIADIWRPLRNDVRETSAEIPYWWRVTTQIWLVLLIGWNKYFPRSTTNQKHYPDLGSDASSAWNFYARFSDVPVVASPNVGCFLTLKLPLLLYAIILHSAPSLVLQPPPDNYCAVPKSRECKLNVAVVETGTGNYS